MFGIFGKKQIQQSGEELAEEGLKAIATAVRNGDISLEQGRLFGDIYLHADAPEGTPRLSYVTISASNSKKVVGRCVLLLDRSVGNAPVWQIDWAIDANERGKGLGKAFVEKSLAEFNSGMKGKFKAGYFIEAVVDPGNSASNKIAERLIGGLQKVKDTRSGRISNNYAKKYEA